MYALRGEGVSEKKELFVLLWKGWQLWMASKLTFNLKFEQLYSIDSRYQLAPLVQNEICNNSLLSTLCYISLIYSVSTVQLSHLMYHILTSAGECTEFSTLFLFCFVFLKYQLHTYVIAVRMAGGNESGSYRDDMICSMRSKRNLAFHRKERPGALCPRSAWGFPIMSFHHDPISETE